MTVAVAPTEQAERARLRANLVETLRHEGALRTEAVTSAFLSVPRELFLPAIAEAEGLAHVYSDTAIFTKRGRGGAVTSSSSQPSGMAAMLQRPGLRPGLRLPQNRARPG